jgi:hypothetical protein
MDHRSGDDLLERVVGELRELPPSDESRVMRIVAAAQAASRRGDEDDDVVPIAAARRGRSAVRGLPLAWAAGLVLAAGIGGYAIGDSRESAPTPVAVSPAPVGAAAMRTVAATDDPNAPRLTQFMIAAPDAERVTLVGDFNGWDAKRTPLVRDPASRLWTATVAIPPGRHTYAFMVDSVLTLDPRAPETTDPDLGTRSSVVLVGGR